MPLLFCQILHIPEDIAHAASFPMELLPNFPKADINITDHYNTVIFMEAWEEVTWH